MKVRVVTLFIAFKVMLFIAGGNFPSIEFTAGEFFVRPFAGAFTHVGASGAAKADISDSIDGRSDLRQLYGAGREKTMDSRELVSIFKRAYFYVALFLLADMVFRFFWLAHYRDRRTTLYTAGVFFALLGSMFIG
jgi:hypothetical protein